MESKMKVQMSGRLADQECPDCVRLLVELDGKQYDITPTVVRGETMLSVRAITGRGLLVRPAVANVICITAEPM